jgi:hypothetical protein
MEATAGWEEKGSVSYVEGKRAGLFRQAKAPSKTDGALLR